MLIPGQHFFCFVFARCTLWPAASNHSWHFFFDRVCLTEAESSCFLVASVSFLMTACCSLTPPPCLLFFLWDPNGCGYHRVVGQVQISEILYGARKRGAFSARENHADSQQGGENRAPGGQGGGCNPKTRERGMTFCRLSPSFSPPTLRTVVKEPSPVGRNQVLMSKSQALLGKTKS